MIHVSEPVLCGNERLYVNQALDANRLSMGPFVERFEEALAAYVGTKHAIACSSGTAALHLALLALGVGPGDEVIVPALTFVATANAVRYCGARPVIVDVDPEHWCMEWRELDWATLTRSAKYILPVHLFGHPANMLHARIAALHGTHTLRIVEDAAEALGAQQNGMKVGTFGELSCFSFYGNKLITCGEGGAVTTDDDELAERVRLYRGQGQGDSRYWHEVLGYNYRMTDLQAAVGLAQLEKIDWHLERRREVAYWYVQHLMDTPVQFQVTAPWAKPAHWMTAVLLPGVRWPGSVARDLAEQGIETRPIFTPLHFLPMYQDGRSRPVAESIAQRGLCLPTHANLTENDVRAVCDALREAMSV